jgi:hypothetical protein
VKRDAILRENRFGSEQASYTYAACSGLNVGIISASRAVKGGMPSPATTRGTIGYVMAQFHESTEFLKMPQHDAYAIALRLAKDGGARKAHTEASCPPYLWPVMEIGYLCRMRGIEVINLTDAHATPEGLSVSRVKGSNDQHHTLDCAPSRRLERCARHPKGALDQACKTSCAQRSSASTSRRSNTSLCMA